MQREREERRASGWIDEVAVTEGWIRWISLGLERDLRHRLDTVNWAYGKAKGRAKWANYDDTAILWEGNSHCRFIRFSPTIFVLFHLKISGFTWRIATRNWRRLLNEMGTEKNNEKWKWKSKTTRDELREHRGEIKGKDEVSMVEEAEPKHMIQ